MKITKIELKGYNQFKDVVIDLTYPRGHEKEGKPLDKICIIGQSGSGKTTLLRLIKWFVSLTRDVGKNVRLPVPPENGVKMEVQLFDFTYRMINTGEYPYFYFDWDGEIEELDFFQLLRENFKKINPLLFNFPTEVITGDNGDEKGEPGTLEMLDRVIAAQVSPYMNKLNLGRSIDFAVGDVDKTLENILEDIKKHQEQELLFNNQIANAASPKDAAGRKSEFNKWLEQNPNPLALMAERYLDDLMFYLGLKVKSDIDKDTISHLGSIQLQTLAGRYVPRNFWSTGTRHLVESTVPLYKLKPQNAIILIDEPERSLYPDIQKGIIDTYVNLAPACQFFFATHSPIIAASFEPWEIVELKFDDEHKYVYRDLHYEGENHVDNYKYFPQYLRWDSILERIFQLEEEGGKKRLKALEKLAEVDIRMGKLKEQGQLNSPEGKKLVKEFKVLSQRVDWEY
jgi:energy-coupling factor transporter ATP-binding protein EcfA2